jgi:hypothetical protein
MQQNITAMESDKKFVPLSKKKTFEVFQVEQDLHIKFIDELHASGGLEDASDPAVKKKQMLDLLVKQCKSHD